MRSLPHISIEGRKPEQQAGRRVLANSEQRNSGVRCMQGRPAGLSRVLIEGAMQQAPQPGRQLKYLFAAVSPAPTFNQDTL
ncbi:MAG: hypothetical protein K8R10_13870 [Rhodocyclales bacterium]|nr:hypothetical protein [Rhodocyclales bacterium]